MIFLRIYLLTGLIIHKVIWEVLRKRGAEPTGGPDSVSLHAIKAVKMFILLGIAVQTMLPDIMPISGEPFSIRVIGISIYTLGLLTAIAARMQLGNNWANIEAGQVLDDQQVVKTGIYGVIRHPIYTGDLLLLTGLELALNSWFVLAVFVLTPVVLYKAIKEEKMLNRELPGYNEYCKKTKRFVPYVI